jgi:uncharacterized protein (TIGR00369 family)
MTCHYLSLSYWFLAIGFWTFGPWIGSAPDRRDIELSCKEIMAQITCDEMGRIAREDVPSVGQYGVIFEEIGDGEVRARLPFDENSLRPGGTVSGPTMMALADIVMWACVLSRIGVVKMAVTTNLNANFLLRPKPGDLIAEGRLLKCGKRLAYGEVTIVSANDPDDPVCHVTTTYSIPPPEFR